MSEDERRNGSLFKKIRTAINRSITYKITTLIVAVMVLALVIGGIVSSLFLERYYTRTKQNTIKSVYEQLAEISSVDTYISSNENINLLDQVCETAGATLIIVDASGTTIYEYGAGALLANRWRDMIFGNDVAQQDEPQVIEQTDTYTLQSTVEKLTSNKYYELFGTLSRGNYFVIRLSVESFRESISIANKFYLGLGIAIILLTTIIIILGARRYTRPVLELADISKKMSKLDFGAKYTGHREDEIGMLGAGMNEMSEKLEKTISELKSANVELHRDIAKKEEVEKMRTEFISNVSHELKTPIALIQGYAEGLQEGINDDPEDIKYYCDVIVDEADKMNNMVKNLLTLDQLEYGSGKIEMEHFDIVSVVAGVIRQLGIKAEQKNVEIRFDSSSKVYVWADEFQIEEVITNYLNNALNHVDDAKLIKVEITEKNDIVRVSVFNTGKPIPKEEFENIWVKFYKVDKARSREYVGNGIGLSIVKAIMDRHGQKCGVINHDNGVEFWFELER